eukprot:m.1312780 g.1312780  ORF g.1312780 m.1312780 type:complete len:830 (-) comp24830_c0_seq20:2177-4666(-)
MSHESAYLASKVACFKATLHREADGSDGAVVIRLNKAKNDNVAVVQDFMHPQGMRIERGDRILSVNSLSTAEMEIEAVTELIQQSMKVDLTLERVFHCNGVGSSSELSSTTENVGQASEEDAEPNNDIGAVHDSVISRTPPKVVVTSSPDEQRKHFHDDALDFVNGIHGDDAVVLSHNTTSETPTLAGAAIDQIDDTDIFLNSDGINTHNESQGVTPTGETGDDETMFTTGLSHRSSEDFDGQMARTIRSTIANLTGDESSGSGGAVTSMPLSRARQQTRRSLHAMDSIDSTISMDDGVLVSVLGRGSDNYAVARSARGSASSMDSDRSLLSPRGSAHSVELSQYTFHMVDSTMASPRTSTHTTPLMSPRASPHAPRRRLSPTSAAASAPTANSTIAEAGPAAEPAAGKQWKDVGVSAGGEVGNSTHATPPLSTSSLGQNRRGNVRRGSLDNPVLLRAADDGSSLVPLRAKSGGDGGTADGSPSGGVEARRKSLSEVLEERRRGSGNISQDSDLHQALKRLTQTRGHKRWADLTPRQRWRSVKDMVMAVLFLKRRYPWFQLSGHTEQFQQHQSPEWILKMVSSYEAKAFPALMGDVLAEFTPEYRGIVTKDGKEFIQLQNLLFGFDSPSGMDCKMGFRTFLGKDVASNKPRMDLLAKLQKLDPSTVTPEEQANGVTKLRYMSHREVMSSTSKLGFRIEAIKMGQGDAKTYKGGEIIQRPEVEREMLRFLENNMDIRDKYLVRLQELNKALRESKFFRRHEMVGSSLLFLHDRHGAVGVWMIDFGKTEAHDGMELDHTTFSEDNLEKFEDGYLLGLENLIDVVSSLQVPT